MFDGKTLDVSKSLHCNFVYSRLGTVHQTRSLWVSLHLRIPKWYSALEPRCVFIRNFVQSFICFSPWMLRNLDWKQLLMFSHFSKNVCVNLSVRDFNTCRMILQTTSLMEAGLILYIFYNVVITDPFPSGTTKGIRPPTTRNGKKQKYTDKECLVTRILTYR